jgi:hypothetical protein
MMSHSDAKSKLPEIFEKITVNLVERASRSLELAVSFTGYSKTDTVNRALQLYAYLEFERSIGNQILIRDAESGKLSRFVLSDNPDSEPGKEQEQ